MSSPELSPNVYGIETEYSCLLVQTGEKIYESVGVCHAQDSKIGLYKAPKENGSQHISSVLFREALVSLGLTENADHMLSNGGRFYIDPSGPEYATPETRTAAEAVDRSFDGDRIVLAIYSYLQEQGYVDSFQFNRRSVDHNRSSRGVHLNTTTNLKVNHEKQPRHIVDKLAALNVVKGAIFGSGGLLINKNGVTEFHHSPRLSVTAHLAEAAYACRPLVRYPFKPDSGDLWRVETVTSDALNFAWPMRGSLVLTNTVLKILELGYGKLLPTLKHPVKAAQRVGKYGNDAWVSPVAGVEDGVVRCRPLDLVRTYCELAFMLNDKHELLDAESKDVLAQILEVADRQTEDAYSVADQVESIARLVAFERKMEKHKLTLDSEGMCRFDYAWDWLGGGVAERLRDKNV